MSAPSHRTGHADLSGSSAIAGFLYAALRRNHLGPREVRIGDRIAIPLE
jgi:hypothetical protein